MITIATYSNIMDANIAAGLLHSEGIECIIQDDPAASMIPIVPNIKLLIADADAERAVVFLRQSDN